MRWIPCLTGQRSSPTRRHATACLFLFPGLSFENGIINAQAKESAMHADCFPGESGPDYFLSTSFSRSMNATCAGLIFSPSPAISKKSPCRLPESPQNCPAAVDWSDSSSSGRPFGMVHAPLCFFQKKSTPGWTRKTSSTTLRHRYSNIPALI